MPDPAGIASLSKPDKSHICQTDKAKQAETSQQAKQDQSQTDTSSTASQKPSPLHNPAIKGQPTEQPATNQLQATGQVDCSSKASNRLAELDSLGHTARESARPYYV